MADTDEGWFDEIKYTNAQLRRRGVKLKPLPTPKPTVRPTEEDTVFLRGCGVRWEKRPEFQLALDFDSTKGTE